jgi:hypothetical protein
MQVDLPKRFRTSKPVTCEATEVVECITWLISQVWEGRSAL